MWHRTTVTQRYWEMQKQRASDGTVTETRVERDEVVSSNASAAPFVVADVTGEVTIAPEGADFDEAERVVQRFESYAPGAAPAQGGSRG